MSNTALTKPLSNSSMPGQSMRATFSAPVTTVGDMRALGESLAQSGMFGERCNAGKGLVIWTICEQSRISLLDFLRTWHVTNDGKITMRADRMLAEYLLIGGRMTWTEFSDKRAAAKWTYRDHENLEIEYTFEEAKKAGLVKEKSGWVRDPGAQLRARCITRAIRMVAPEVLAGVYAPEELEVEAEMIPEPENRPPVPLQEQIDKTVEMCTGKEPEPAQQPQPETQESKPTPEKAEKPKAKAKAKKEPKPTEEPPPKPQVIIDGKAVNPEDIAKDPTLCPISSSQFYGQEWAKIDRKVLERAQNIKHETMTSAHVKEIQKILADYESLPF